MKMNHLFGLGLVVILMCGVKAMGSSQDPDEFPYSHPQQQVAFWQQGPLAIQQADISRPSLKELCAEQILIELVMRVSPTSSHPKDIITSQFNQEMLHELQKDTDCNKLPGDLIEYLYHYLDGFHLQKLLEQRIYSRKAHGLWWQDFTQELAKSWQVINTAIGTEKINEINALMLYSKGLSLVPTIITMFTKLEDLDLGGNQFTELPAEIGNLINLKYLNLENNKLTALPAEIGNLINLKYLNLENNKLTALPDQIRNLKIKGLFLENNNFTALPEGIKSTKLTEVPPIVRTNFISE